MYSVSDKFKQYIAQNDRLFECQAMIGGVLYSNTDIIGFTIEDSLTSAEELELGSVIASKIVISLRTQNTIPVNAEIRPEVRMNGTDGYTEWVKLGTYYIDARIYKNEVWELTGYDKLITVNQTFVSALTYPISMQAVIDEIGTQLGLDLDSSMIINPAYEIPYKDLEITIRDMLSYIASAHGACTKITKDGKLAHVKFKIKEPSVIITPSDYVTLTQTNPVKSYTKVKVTYNTDGEFLEVGTGDDAHTLKFYNQFITPAMLDAIYATLNGFKYVPFIMPWKGNVYTEVGDTIKAGKTDLLTWSGCQYTWAGAAFTWEDMSCFNTIVLRNKITFRGGLKTESSAPAESQQQSEFAFKGTLGKRVDKIEKTAVTEEKPYNGVVIGRANGIVVTRSDGRVKVTTNATTGFKIQVDRGAGSLEDALYYDVNEQQLILKSAKEQYDSVSGRVSTAEASIVVNANQIATKVSQTDYDTWGDTIESSITQNAQQINLKVSKADIISEINQTAETIKIAASKIDLQGYVTITDLSGQNATTIDGSNIKTGTITGVTVQTGLPGTQRLVLSGGNLMSYDYADRRDGISIIKDTFRYYLSMFYHDSEYGKMYVDSDGSIHLTAQNSFFMDWGGSGSGYLMNFGTSGRHVKFASSAEFDTAIYADSDFYHRGSRLTFFNGYLASKRTVSYPSNIVTTQSAASTYGNNEQNMLNNLRTDIVNLRGTVNSLVEAGKTYNLV